MRTFILVLSLLSMLGLAAGVAGLIWWELRDVEMGLHGTLALLLGVVVSLALGIGLMFLIFYSARHGHDDTIG